jgi:multiple antibiotic resistance protein
MPGSDQIAFALLVVSSLVAIVNPVSAVPMYLAMTAEYPRAERVATLRRAIATSVLVLWAFGFLGTAILHFFGITTYAFRITGGLLFLGVGSDMLEAKRSRVKTTESEEEDAMRCTSGASGVPASTSCRASWGSW